MAAQSAAPFHKTTQAGVQTILRLADQAIAEARKRHQVQDAHELGEARDWIAYQVERLQRERVRKRASTAAAEPRTAPLKSATISTLAWPPRERLTAGDAR